LSAAAHRCKRKRKQRAENSSEKTRDDCRAVIEEFLSAPFYNVHNLLDFGSWDDWKLRQNILYEAIQSIFGYYTSRPLAFVHEILNR
jgi:hypothetical protein